MTKLLELEMEALVNARIYPNMKELTDDAVRALFRIQPHLKMESAIELYRQRKVSISRAAEIAGMCLEDFKRTISEKGTPAVIEAPSVEDIKVETKLILKD